MSSQLQEKPKNFDILAGGGEMGERMRALDWSKTPLGEPDRWPQSLKTIVRVMLDSRYAMWMLWGPELTFFCNDAYLPTVGMKRDWVLGARSDKVWEEIWPDIGPRIQRVLEEGRATWDEGLPLFLERFGFAEETYHTFSYSPIYDDNSRIAGMLCVVTEVTERVIGERRLRVLRDLAASLRAESTEEACARLMEVLSNYRLDLPFAALFLVDQSHGQLTLAQHFGDLPETLALAHAASERRGGTWPLHEVAQSGTAQVVTLPRAGHGPTTAQRSPGKVGQAMILPIRQGSGMSIAVLVAGVSPQRPLDDGYTGFLDLIVRQFVAAISTAQSYEAERARAQALADIDRAKTAFFSNVSHEFRTPLTLLLGPLEEALRTPRQGLSGEALESAHRNALRLLRLVNSLLDFSRIEAGRLQAHYQPCDLGALTRELASAFQSAMDRAGLKFVIACQTLPEAVYVDKEMWEKIVLNLLSNAFKYTFSGEIRIEITEGNGGAELVVADTGIGIPSEALPQLFDRFYRVPGSNGRTHEGSGIGLSLVRELVTLHGGTIWVESEPGRGSRFRVHLPFGASHLPIAQIAREGEIVATPSGAQAFADEAQRWLPESAFDAAPDSAAALEAAPAAAQVTEPAQRASILVVDDSRDMRDYISRLLRPQFNVILAVDGKAALDLIDTGITPDLILSDVMMPRIDGLELLSALRSHARTATIPIILLSARAGEEARLEGLDSGADDYLVKPFSARELLTRVQTHIRLNLLRRTAAEQVKASDERLRIAVDEAGMGTWDLDLRTRELRWSRSHYTLLGYPPDQSTLATEEMWRSRIHPEDRAIVASKFQEARDARSLYSQEFRIVRADDGAVRWLRVLGSFLYDEAQAPIRSLGVVFDDTVRITAEIGLRDADRRKDVFLATLAHELRNPLAPIRNAAQVLGSSSVGSERLQWARGVIQRQVKHMAFLLDDLLDVARITQGKLALKKQHVTLNTVIDSAVEAARPLLDSKSHRLIVTMPAETIFLDADPLRLSQVISNLLTNAAKYTNAGGHITLSGKIESGVLALSVKDDGIGIPPESLKDIFAMFSQVEGASVRSEGGLGIGLALVNGLTELHGGRVEAKSKGPGHGSEFIVRLPVLINQATPAHHFDAPAPEPSRTRILVADDNIDAADSLALLLDMAGHDVRVVHDGRAALSVAQSFRPDTVLLDIGMPLMSGYEVARALRQEPWGAKIILIALTGWGQESDRLKAMEAGFDRHLTKPVDPDMLEQLMNSPAEAANNSSSMRDSSRLQ